MPENDNHTRAAKDERRARQRAASILRAQKMHAARIASEQQSTLQTATENKLPQFIIGCSGWFYWDWKGIFYPRKRR